MNISLDVPQFILSLLKASWLLPSFGNKAAINIHVQVFGFFLNKFIYFWLHWVFVAAGRLSLVAAGFL